MTKCPFFSKVLTKSDATSNMLLTAHGGRAMDFSAESHASSEEKPEAAAEPAREDSHADTTPTNFDTNAGAANGMPPIPASVTRMIEAIEAAKDAAKNSENRSDKPKDVEPAKVPPIPSSALVILPPSSNRFEAKDEASAAAPKAKRSAWRTTASRAAIALIVFGCAFAVGARFLGVTSPAGSASQSASASQG